MHSKGLIRGRFCNVTSYPWQVLSLLDRERFAKRGLSVAGSVMLLLEREQFAKRGLSLVGSL